MKSPDPLLAFRLGSDSPLRLPDESAEPTAATVLRNEYTLTSSANGDIVFAECPPLASALRTFTITAGAVSAAADTAHPQRTAFLAEARYARLVAWRVQIVYIGAEQESAGYLSCSTKHPNDVPIGALLDGLHTGAPAQVRATDGLIVHGNFLQTPRWEDPNSATFMYGGTYQMIVIACSGLPPSKPVLRVRVSRFMEYVPVEGALAEGELMHEPVNPAAMAVHGQLSGPSMSISTVKDRSGYMTALKGAASAAYHMVQPVVANYVVPAAREYLQSMVAARTTAVLKMV